MVMTDFEIALNHPVVARGFREAFLNPKAPPANAFTADHILALQ